MLRVSVAMARIQRLRTVIVRSALVFGVVMSCGAASAATRRVQGGAGRQPWASQIIRPSSDPTPAGAWTTTPPVPLARACATRASSFARPTIGHVAEAPTGHEDDVGSPTVPEFDYTPTIVSFTRAGGCDFIRRVRQTGLAQVLHPGASGQSSLVNHDLDDGCERDGDDRPDDAQERGSDHHGEDRRERGKRDGATEDDRIEDVVLDLLIDELDREHRDRRRGIDRESGEDEDHRGDRRAQLWDQVEQTRDDGEDDREREGRRRTRKAPATVPAMIEIMTLPTRVAATAEID